MHIGLDVDIPFIIFQNIVAPFYAMGQILLEMGVVDLKKKVRDNI